MTTYLHRSTHRRFGAGLAVALSAATVLSAGGCQRSATDEATAIAEPAVRRYDIVQTLAAQGATVVAGTQTGAVLASRDGGQTWDRHFVGPQSFVAIAGCPDGSFVAVDFYHHVVRLDAAGKPGKPLPLEQPGTPLAVACDAQGRWWVAGTFSTLAMSADQGATWSVTEFGEDAHLTALQFIDATHAVLVGEFGLIFASSDGGANWTRGPALPNEFYPYTAHFNTPDEGWVAGIAGQVLRTGDGGATWSREENAAGFPLYRLFAVDGRLLGVGPAGIAQRDASGTWQAVPAQVAPPAFLGAATPTTGATGTAVVLGGVGMPQVVALGAG